MVICASLSGRLFVTLEFSSSGRVASSGGCVWGSGKIYIIFSFQLGVNNVGRHRINFLDFFPRRL
jgi:hypothetical protein